MNRQQLLVLMQILKSQGKDAALKTLDMFGEDELASQAKKTIMSNGSLDDLYNKDVESGKDFIRNISSGMPQEVVDAEVNLYAEERSNELAASKNKPQSLSFVEEKEPEDLPVIAPNPNSKASNLSQYVDIVGSVNPKLVPQAAEIAKTAGISVQQPVQPEQQQVQAPVQPSAPAQQETQAPVQPQTKSNGYVDLASRFGANPIQQPMDLMEESVKKISAENKLPPPSLNFLRIKDTRTGQEYVTNNKGEFTEIFNYEDVAKEKGVYDPIVGVMSLLSPEGGTVRQKRTKEDLQEGLRAGKYQIVTNDNGKPAYSNPNDFYYQAPDGFTFDPATKRVRGYDKDTNEYIDKILSDSEIEEFVNKYNTKLTKVSKTKSAQLDEDGNLKASSDWSVSAELPMPVTFSWAAEQELDRAKQSLFSQGFDWIKEKIGASEMLRDEQGRPVYKGYDPNRHKDQELKFTTEKKKFLANIPPANTKYYNTQGEVFVIKDGGNADVFDDKGNKLAEINAVTMAELYASNKLSKGKELFNEKQIEDQKTSYAESLKQKMLQVDKATIKKENDMVKIITKDGVSTFTNDAFNNYRRPVKMSDGTVQNMTPKEFYEYYNDAKQYERDAIQAEIDGLDDWTVTSLIKQALPGFTQGAVGATKTLLNVPTYIHNVFSQTFGNKNYVTDDRYKMVYDPETGTYTNLDKKLIDKRVKAISHLEEFQKKREALNITSPENKNAKIIGNAIGQLGSQALVGAVGGWTASMAYMGAQGFNDNYQQALQMQTEKNPFMATLYAGTASAVEIASEYYLSPLRKLAKATTKLDDFTYAMKRATFDKVSKVMPSVENKFLGEAGKYMLNETGELVLDKNLARRIVRNGIDLTQDVLEESVSEGLAAFGNNAAYNLMVSNTKDLTEGILDSMIGGGGAGAFANILRKSVSKLNKNNDAYSPALQEQFEENLKKAETNATNIERHINNTPDQFFFKFNVDRGNGKSEPVYMYKNQDDPASKPMVIDEATYKAGTIAFIPRAYRANDVEGAKAHLQQINELTGSQMKWEDVTASGNEASVKDFYKFLNKQRSQSSTLLEQNPDKQLEAYKLATNKNPDQSDERTEEEIRTAAANMKLALFPDLFSTPRAAYKSSFPTGSFTQAELDQDGNVVEGITTPYQVAYVGQDSNGVRVFELTDMDGNKIDVGQSVLEGMVPAGETGTLFSELFSLSVQPNPNLNPNVPSSIDVQPAPSNVAIKPDFAEVSINNKKDAEDAITGNRLEGSQKTIAEAIAGEKGIKFTDTKGKEHTGKPENLKSNSDGSVTFKIGNKNYQLGKVENVELMPEEEVKPVETPKEEAPKAEKEKATEMSKEETTEAPKEEAPTDVENKEGTTEVPKEETPKEEKKETPETKEGVYVLTDKKSFDTAIDALVAANILTEQEGDLVKRMNTAYAALYKAITGTENYYTTLGSIKVVDKIDEEGTIRGQYNKIDNIPSITIAKNAGIKPDLSTVVHEIAHANRQIFFGILYTKEYFIPLRLRSKLELLKKSIEKKCGVLDGKWTVENEEAYAELIEKLMTDPTFINRMIPSERTLYTFLRDSIKYVFNKLRSIVLKPSDIYTQLTDVYSADFLDDISDFKRYNDLERLNYLLNVYPSSKLTKYFPNMEVEIVDGIRVLKNRQVFEDMRTELINKTIERQQAEMQKEIEQAGDASLNQTGDVTLNQQTKPKRDRFVKALSKIFPNVKLLSKEKFNEVLQMKIDIARNAAIFIDDLVFSRQDDSFKKSLDNSPYKNILDFSKIDHVWAAKVLMLGFPQAKQLKTLKDIEEHLQRVYDNMFTEENLRKYILTDFSESYIKFMMSYENTNPESRSLFEMASRDPELRKTLVQNTQEEHLKNIFYYKKMIDADPQFSTAFKINLFHDVIRYNTVAKKLDDNSIVHEKSKRGKNTAKSFTELNISVLKKLNTEEYAKSNNSFLDSYIDYIKNNKQDNSELLKEAEPFIHQKTSEGIWYKFGRRSEMTSDLVSRFGKTTVGQLGEWCTSSMRMAQTYLKLGDLYIYYSFADAMSTIQINVESKKAKEIAGTNSNQELFDKDMTAFDDFINNNPSIEFKSINDYNFYSKIIRETKRGIKDINKDYGNDEIKRLLEVKKYYKDETNDLEELKSSINQHTIARAFGIKEGIVYVDELPILDDYTGVALLYLEKNENLLNRNIRGLSIYANDLNLNSENIENVTFYGNKLIVSGIDNRITSLKGFTFNGNILSVRYNMITSLDGFTFKGDYLDLYDNQIDSLDGFTFNGKELYLGRNNITSLDGFTFNGEYLDLANNNITSLDGFTFNGEYLDLANNNITSLDGFTFNGEYLDLTNNNITSLDGFTFNGNKIPNYWEFDFNDEKLILDYNPVLENYSKDEYGNVQGFYDRKKDEIVVNDEALDPDKIIYHELVHRFFNNLDKNSELYKLIEPKILELIEFIKQDKALFDLITKQYNQSEVNEELIANYIADLIAKKMQPIKNKTLMQKINSIINTVVEYIKNLAGLREMSNEDIKDLTVSEFADKLANTILKDNIGNQQSSGDVTLNQQTKPKQKPSPEFQSKVIQRLKSIFPNVQIADVNDFYSKGRELGFTNQQLERSNAFITPERIIYISPDNVNETTALHEFSHVFIDQMKKENPELYTEIARQIVKTGYMQWADSTYPELPVESRMEEAIAEAIATEARGMLTETGDLKQRTAIAKLKKLIKDFWNAVAKALNIKKDPRYVSVNQFINESAEQMVYKPDVNFDEFVSRMIQAGNLIAVCT